MTKDKSAISGKSLLESQKVNLKSLRHSISQLIYADYPDIAKNGCISREELNYYREKYLVQILGKNLEEITEQEKLVIESITNHTTLVDNSNLELSQPTLGQRIADKVATFGGSWTFIISFGFFILVWICVNIYWLANKGFDPYPFILLNLILSCLASMQAPVIMMSQNRKDEKDRIEAEKDYLINLKSELEIRTLHEKIDHLMLHQQQELLEMQKIQVEMLNDILNK
ncbi:DUF1003 domain-containing protein [Arcticibacterium luteifluviistationis]|uniref:DUF1003 domain-containing protein n=1 Tax=Arcticibacterium luteifluviistationis TaxID=1784714 RepID=A0A2Z4G8G7_9BACT|nr:DUF1003 domain-containing protein [Arcticibacterium luteifluviistationis]AWV97487.1 hypothetical protein DJ013_04605 [Arcticibacterium luteifluviistationis]